MNNVFFELGPYKFSYDYKFYCPDVKRTDLTRGQFQNFTNNGFIKHSVDRVASLPHGLLCDLRIVSLEKIDSEYKVVRDKNFLEVADDLPIIDYLNDMLSERDESCFSTFINYVPLLFLLRDEIHTSTIDHYIERENFLYPSCIDIICSKEVVKKIIYEAPIFLPNKHLVESSHRQFGQYYLESNKPLIPDSYIINKSFLRNSEKSVGELSERIPWESKEMKLYWRGQNGQSSYDTGDCIADAYNGKYPRLGMAFESLDHPDFLDVRFSSTYRESLSSQLNCIKSIISSNNITPELLQVLFIDSPANKFEHIENKYLLSMDGWSSAWGRVPWILSSNSALVKHKSTTVQWFDSEMKKGEHYIELPENFNILDFKEWALSNDSKAKEIADKGRELYLQLFSEKNMEDITFTIIKDYYDAYLIDDIDFQTAESPLTQDKEGIDETMTL